MCAFFFFFFLFAHGKMYAFAYGKMYIVCTGKYSNKMYTVCILHIGKSVLFEWEYDVCRWETTYILNGKCCTWEIVVVIYYGKYILVAWEIYRKRHVVCIWENMYYYTSHKLCCMSVHLIYLVSASFLLINLSGGSYYLAVSM